MLAELNLRVLPPRFSPAALTPPSTLVALALSPVPASTNPPRIPVTLETRKMLFLFIRFSRPGPRFMAEAQPLPPFALPFPAPSSNPPRRRRPSPRVPVGAPPTDGHVLDASRVSPTTPFAPDPLRSRRFSTRMPCPPLRRAPQGDRHATAHRRTGPPNNLCHKHPRREIR